MSTKVLSITLKTIDQSTAPIRGVISQVAKLTSSITSAMTSVRTVVGVFAASVVGGKLISSIQGTIDRLDELSERSRAIGVTAEALQVYEYAAKQANVRSDELFAAIRKGTENFAEFAATMGGPAANAIRQLGINTRDAAGELRPMGDLIEDIRKKTASMGAGDRQRTYGDIFGKGGQLVERLTAGAGYDAARGELNRLGGLVSNEDIARASKVSDAIDRMSVAFRGLKEQAIIALSGPLIDLFNAVAENLSRIQTLVRGVGAYLMGTQERGGEELNKQLGEAVIDALKAAANYAWTAIKEGAELIRVAVVNALSAAINVIWPILDERVAELLYKIDQGLPIGMKVGAKPTLGMKSRADASLLANKQSALDQVRAMTADFVNIPGVEGVEGTDRNRLQAIKELEEEVQRLEVISARSRNAFDKSMKTVRDESYMFWSSMVKDTKTASREAAESLGDAGRAFVDAMDVIRNIQALQQDTKNRVVAFGGDDLPAVSVSIKESFEKAFGGAVKMMQAAAGPVGRIYDSVKSKVLEIVRLVDTVQQASVVGGVLRGLEIRSLEASGQGGRAALMRQSMEQDAEQVQVQQALGAAYARVRDALLAVQAAERNRLLVDTTLSQTIADLTRQENAYAQAVQVRAAEVSAGTITARVADIANKEGLRSLLAATESAKSSVQGLIDANPALREQLLPTLTDLAAKIADIQAKTSGAPTTSFFDGLQRGWKDVTDKVRDYAALANDLVSTTVNGIAGGIASAFTDAVEGVKSFGSAVADMGRNVLRVVSQMIIQFLVMKAIVGIGGAIAGGAGGGDATWAGPNSIPGTFANKGGIIRRKSFATGGMVGLASLGMVAGPNVNIDRVPAVLTAGEFVSNRASTRMNLAALQYANNGGEIGPVGSGGGGGGGINIYQTINISGGSGSSAQAAGRAAREGVMSALDDAGVREKIKRVVG